MAGYPLAMAARDLQERIKKLIVDQRLPSGAPLPTEPELMRLLGASRNSVREALKALQAMGIVEIRHGFGTYVGSMSFAPMIEGLAFRTVVGHYRGEDSLLQLLELREAVETGLVSRLAGRLPEADLGELEALVERMEQQAAEGASLAETDRAFHATLYRGWTTCCSARCWRRSGTPSTGCGRTWWRYRRIPGSPAVSTGRSWTRYGPATPRGPSGP